MHALILNPSQLVSRKLGSLLGPLLFSLFIDDLCKIDFDNSTKVCLYADDTAVFVRGTNPIQISNTLQEEIDKICNGNWLQKIA